MDFLTSSLLSGVPGLTHGFGMRMTGSRAAVREEARRAFLESGGVFFLQQVHGCTVVRSPWTEPPEADASVAHGSGSVLAIETADCLPLLLVDPTERRVAAVHAGWRGTAFGVARETIRTLVEAGSEPKVLLAALGPAIGACCYEVGRDVEEAFGPAGSKFFRTGPGSRKHLDVVAANRAQLEEVGLVSANIDSIDLCTRCRGDLFFSYRRDGASAGRMISVIGFSR